jgi:hypothetical protein
MSNGVYTLTPGSTRPVDQRPDWTPIAQSPDRYGIMAHTPDPRAYHFDAGGRVIIPRGSQHGGSRGFSTEAGGVVNIDPSDPVRGTGGITVNLRELNRDAIPGAIAQADGDPLTAWALASQQAALPPPPQMVARTAPTGYGPYVVPATTPSGGQIVSPLSGGMNPAFTPAMIRPAVSPAVAAQGASMAVPSTAQWQAPQSPVAAAPVPGNGQAYQQPQMPVQAVQQPPVASQAPADQTQLMMLTMMSRMMEAMERLGAPQAPQPPPQYQPPQPPPQYQATQVPYPAYPPYQQSQPRVPSTPPYQSDNLAHDDEDDAEEQAPRAHRPPAPKRGYAGQPAVPPNVDLPYLTDPPSKPRLRVVFNLGRGGVHSKYFHAYYKRGMCLSLVYDERYDGDRFIPPETEEGESIVITIEESAEQSQTYNVAVRNFHQKIGCLDVLNLIVLPAKRAAPAMEMEDQE